MVLVWKIKNLILSNYSMCFTRICFRKHFNRTWIWRKVYLSRPFGSSWFLLSPQQLTAGSIYPACHAGWESKGGTVKGLSLLWLLMASLNHLSLVSPPFGFPSFLLWFWIFLSPSLHGLCNAWLLPYLRVCFEAMKCFHLKSSLFSQYHCQNVESIWFSLWFNSIYNFMQTNLILN